MSLLIDTQRGRADIEFYVPDDKEIGLGKIGACLRFNSAGV